MKTEKERMLQALVHINDIQTLIKDNQFEKYLQDHLIVVEYELQRQLSLINADESDDLETAKLIEVKDKVATESLPYTKWR